MVLEGLRSYVQIATGLGEMTRHRAMAAARSLLAQGEAGLGQVVPVDVRDQVSAVAEELLATGRANRDLLVGLVGAEVERQVHRLGLVSAEELRAAQARADRLEARLHDLEQQRAGGSPVPEKRATTRTTARRGTAKRAAAAPAGEAESEPTAQRTVRKRTVAKRAGADTAATTETGTTETGAKQAGTKRAGTKRAGTKQAGTKQAGTKQAGTKQAGTKQAARQRTGTKPAEAATAASASPRRRAARATSTTEPSA